MAGYTKLFSSILDSTIWRTDSHTRVVWITMLAMADKNGIVECSIPGLADRARVSIPELLGALETLKSPDEYSRSHEHEGRRIGEVDGGYQILNHAKYREKMNADERREYLRKKQADRRAVNTVSTNVNKCSDSSTVSTHAEAEAYTEATTETKPDPRQERVVVGFELENFDADVHFEHLCRVYKKAERGYGAQTAFCEAIEYVVRQHKLTRPIAAGYIINKAEKYCELEQFQKGMTNWLRDKIFEQDESVWRRKENGIPKPNGKQSLEELYPDA